MAPKCELAASTAAFAGHPLTTALRGVAEAGYKVVEIACVRGLTEHIAQEEMTAQRAAEVRSLLAEYGLTTYALSAHMDLAAPNACTDFAQRMQFAHDIGAALVVTNVSPPATRDTFIANLASLLPLASALDVTIGLEAPGHLLVSSAEYSDILSRLDSDRVRLNFDVGNVFTASLGTVDPIPELQAVLPHVVQLHLKDAYLCGDVWRFAPVGQGEVGYDRVLALTAHLPMTVELPLLLEGKGRGRAYVTGDAAPYEEAVAGLRVAREYILRHMQR